MDTRFSFSVVFIALISLLSFCSYKSFHSNKSIGKYVGQLDLALIPPIFGNLIVLSTNVEQVATIGYYIYFFGMDLIMFFLIRFTDRYCQGLGNGTQKPTVMYAALTADTFQMMLNIFFGHAFSIECITVDGDPYYRMVPHWGQMIHRIICYLALLAVLLIFLLASIKSAKIYRERFTILLFTMITIGVWQSFYIFTRTPIDRSVIGYGCYGVIITYFSIYYRPLRLLDRMLSNIAADIPDGLLVFDPAGKCIWANSRAFNMLGAENNDLESVPEKLIELFGDHKYEKNDWTENRVIGMGDSTCYYTIKNRSVSDDDMQIAGSFLVIRDNTEEQKRVRQEFYTSTHDILTGLYTKQYFFECIRIMLAANPDTEYTAIFIDVKNFKIVNDIFSTDFGDIALKQLADWIRANMNEQCVYGRLAGDTFGVFVPKGLLYNDKARIEDELSHFVATDGNIEHHLLIHLGVYEVADRELDVSVMFDRAHLALSTITNEYNTHIAYYDNKLRERVLWNQRIIAELNTALSEHQIRPYLQPITDKTGKVVGAEALARWIHSEHGFMSPGTFIPIFEQNGLIIEIDRHMWRCACELLAKWKSTQPELFISVNISPKDFYFTDVAAEIKALVKEYDIHPSSLRIEITETVMMNDSKEKMKVLDDLRSCGFIIEMDDFGSGFSSLNLLKDMPVDVLKLDMKFLSSSDDDQKAQTIIRNIIRLSYELGIASLTEGVETQQQFSQLSEMGCQLFQGYYFAKPMPTEDFEKFVRDNS